MSISQRGKRALCPSTHGQVFHLHLMTRMTLKGTKYDTCMCSCPQQRAVAGCWHDVHLALTVCYASIVWDAALQIRQAFACTLALLLALAAELVP